MQTRRQRKKGETRTRKDAFRRFILVTTLSIVAIVPVGLLVEPNLPPFLTEEMPKPDIPRLFPFTPPLHGGPESEHRPEVPIRPRPGMIFRAATDSRLVALTFDDGPDPLFTPRLLRILRDEGVPATFFVIANRAQINPHLVRQMVEEGHEVGNHTLSHPRLTELSPELVRYEILEAKSILEQIVGHTISLFRPPYGRINDYAIGVAAEAGMSTIMWSVDSRDWEGITAEEIQERVIPNVTPGGIILMHCAGGVQEDYTSTLEALPVILRQLRALGYTMVTVSQLLRAGEAY